MVVSRFLKYSIAPCLKEVCMLNSRRTCTDLEIKSRVWLAGIDQVWEDRQFVLNAETIYHVSSAGFAQKFYQLVKRLWSRRNTSSKQNEFTAQLAMGLVVLTVFPLEMLSHVLQGWQSRGSVFLLGDCVYECSFNS